MHLAAQADCVDLGGRDGGGGQHLADAGDGGVPPDGGVLLAPQLARGLIVIGCAGDADHRALFVHEQGFGGGG